MGNGSSVATELTLCGGDPALKKHTERGSSESQQLEYAVSAMQGRRHSMEDKHLLVSSLTSEGGKETVELEDHSLFAVFDGHGGEFASNYISENFLKVFSKRPELAKYAALPNKGNKSREDTNGVSLLRQALVSTFYLLDAMLIPLQKERDAWIKRRHQEAAGIPDLEVASDSDDGVETEQSVPFDEAKSTPGERSGSTCVIVMLSPSHVLCANTGDSRALLRRTGAFLPLSFDHKPSEVSERTRVTSAGGFVKSKRVDGDLAVSRAFGDFIYKSDTSLAPSAQKVTVTPDIVIYPRILQTDEFLVLACDGVWDVADSGECAQFVQTMLSEGESDLGSICEEALDICLERQSRDNMTFMIVGLPGMKVDRSRSARARNVLWGSRTARSARVMKDSSKKAAKSGMKALGKEVGIEGQNCECID